MASGDKIYIGIKSIQRGVITIPTKTKDATVTINEVDTSKAIVVFSGSVLGTHQSDAYSGNATAYLQLTNSTTVTATRYGNSSEYTVTIPYQVIEFH